MTKTELIDIVSDKANLSKKDTKIAVDSIIDVITEALAKGDSVNFIGFGTFLTTKREERTARVPRTGEEIKIPATTVAKFKAGKTLKEAVANAK